MKISFYIFIFLVLQGCALHKNNDYAVNFKELRRVSELDSLLKTGPTFYPTVTEFSNSNDCMKAYKEHQKEGFLHLDPNIITVKESLVRALRSRQAKNLGPIKFFFRMNWQIPVH